MVDDELEALHQLGRATGVGAAGNAQADQTTGHVEPVEHLAVALEGTVGVAAHEQRDRQTGLRREGMAPR